MKLAQDETGYILVGDSHPTEAFFQSAPALEAYELAKETVNGFLTSVNRGEKVTCCEVVVGEYRFKVCAGMPEGIEAYVDYVEPRDEPKPEPEMQYINRRETMPDGVTRGDGALWPTFAPITSPGWVQIGERPVGFGYHSDGDTVLIFDRTAQPESKMQRGVVFSTNHRPDNRVWVKDNYGAEITAPNELLINFSKGDHLSAAEREAWHQEATGFQDSYYSTFKP